MENGENNINKLSASFSLHTVVICVMVFVCLSDHNAGTPGPICLKFGRTTGMFLLTKVYFLGKIGKVRVNGG